MVHLKWTSEMELSLVKQIFLRAAYTRGGENLADKYKVIQETLWKLEIFKSRKPLGHAMIQKKFTELLTQFRLKHGFSDDGQRANMSAIPEELSEIDQILQEIHDQFEAKAQKDRKQKNAIDEMKSVISKITDVIVSGDGRAGLKNSYSTILKLAN